VAIDAYELYRYCQNSYLFHVAVTFAVSYDFHITLLVRAFLSLNILDTIRYDTVDLRALKS